MSPQADAPCPANMNLNQEQHCDDGLLQSQTTHRGSSSLASDHFQRSYHIIAPAQLRTMEKRSTNPSSSKHKKKKKGKMNRSTTTPLQAPDHPEHHIGYQDNTDPSCPTTTTFQGSYDVTIYGQPDLLNNNKIAVNPQSNLGGSQAVENFKQSVSFEAIQDTRHHDIDPVIRAKTLKLSRNWMDNPNATERIAWLHGPASIGKTAIALEIARQKNVVATFFFNKSDTIRCDGNRVFLTLAWQLAVSIPDMKDHIIRSINKYSVLPQKSVEEQFEYLIAQPFAAMKKVTSTERPSGLVVVIDGIDECADMGLRRRILKVIGKATLDHRVPLRFIICSRPNGRTRFIFGQLQCPVLSIDLAEFRAEQVRRRGERIRTGGVELERQDEELMEREEEPEKSDAFRLLLLLLISLFVRTGGEELERQEEEPMGREKDLAKPLRLLLFILISPFVFLVFLLPILLFSLFVFFPLFLFFFVLRLLSSISAFVLRLPFFLFFFVFRLPSFLFFFVLRPPSFLFFLVLRLMSSLLLFVLRLLAPLLFFVLRLLASLLFSLSFLLSSLSSLFSSLSSLLSSLPVFLSSLDPPLFNLLLVTIIAIPIIAVMASSNGNARRHTF